MTIKGIESLILCSCGNWMNRRWTGSGKIMYYIDYCPECEPVPKVKKPQGEIIDCLKAILRSKKFVRVEYNLNVYSEPGMFCTRVNEFGKKEVVCYIRKFLVGI